MMCCAEEQQLLVRRMRQCQPVRVPTDTITHASIYLLIYLVRRTWVRMCVLECSTVFFFHLIQLECWVGVLYLPPPHLLFHGILLSQSEPSHVIFDVIHPSCAPSSSWASVSHFHIRRLLNWVSSIHPFEAS